ncbi:type II toxin-antitoxin system VapC family toxin [Agromyces archimandritae]|uniref:PIN domain-containing protein n=1 Tax=Agromyces archimandritae TaxID=2781962 RepID=A0A975FJR6_9MICO|nr:PIN domain-containing protein [Agromyces archimandritae]QTX03780.1 PIN domain-containing protein [Agromyces archimandritae]
MTVLTAFDADVLIYTANAGHPLGRRILPLFDTVDEAPIGIGSTLLLPEVLAKPVRRDPESAEAAALLGLIARLELRPFDEATARLATVLAADYGLRAADAAHLATAVVAGADRFLTNNTKDFPRTITDIEVVYPADLPDPG